MMTRPPSKQTLTANDIASLFLAQKLGEQKERVQRWSSAVLEAETMGKEASCNLFLHEHCNLGQISVIISAKQAVWLATCIARESHARGKRILRQEGKAFYEGREVGTWYYGERDFNDPYERIGFHLDVDFVRTYMQADETAIRIVAAQIEPEHEKDTSPSATPETDSCNTAR